MDDVLGHGYRPPALTAKMAGTLQVLSGGRFILGIGPAGGPKSTWPTATSSLGRRCASPSWRRSSRSLRRKLRDVGRRPALRDARQGDQRVHLEMLQQESFQLATVVDIDPAVFLGEPSRLAAHPRGGDENAPSALCT